MCGCHVCAQFIATSEPVTLAEYALGLVVFTYLAPSVAGLVGGSFRYGPVAFPTCMGTCTCMGSISCIHAAVTSMQVQRWC